MLDAIVDLSHYNADVNFPQARQGGLVGVVHKATQGLQEQDPAYAGRRPQALAAGLLWGAYHFGTDADGAAQAAHFLGVVKPAPSDLLMLDLEPNPGGTGMSRGQAEAFVQAVHQATGRYPGLYSTNAYLVQQGADHSPILAQCWLWMAEYNASIAAPAHPAAWPTWTMWQYTDGRSGRLPHQAPGIGACDRDLFNGELAQLQRLWNVADGSASGSSPTP